MDVATAAQRIDEATKLHTAALQSVTHTAHALAVEREAELNKSAVDGIAVPSTDTDNGRES